MISCCKHITIFTTDSTKWTAQTGTSFYTGIFGDSQAFVDQNIVMIPFHNTEEIEQVELRWANMPGYPDYVTGAISQDGYGIVSITVDINNQPETVIMTGRYYVIDENNTVVDFLENYIFDLDPNASRSQAETDGITILSDYLTLNQSFSVLILEFDHSFIKSYKDLDIKFAINDSMLLKISQSIDTIA